MNKQLTKHFNLDEFFRSTMTDDNDSLTLTDDNDHDCEVIENLRNLCTEVLEPLREYFGVPVIVSSGYRSSNHRSSNHRNIAHPSPCLHYAFTMPSLWNEQIADNQLTFS